MTEKEANAEILTEVLIILDTIVAGLRLADAQFQSFIGEFLAETGDENLLKATESCRLQFMATLEYASENFNVFRKACQNNSSILTKFERAREEPRRAEEEMLVILELSILRPEGPPN